MKANIISVATLSLVNPRSPTSSLSITTMDCNDAAKVGDTHQTVRNAIKVTSVVESSILARKKPVKLFVVSDCESMEMSSDDDYLNITNNEKEKNKESAINKKYIMTSLERLGITDQDDVTTISKYCISNFDRLYCYFNPSTPHIKDCDRNFGQDEIDKLITHLKRFHGVKLKYNPHNSSKDDVSQRPLNYDADDDKSDNSLSKSSDMNAMPIEKDCHIITAPVDSNHKEKSGTKIILNSDNEGDTMEPVKPDTKKDDTVTPEKPNAKNEKSTTALVSLNSKEVKTIDTGSIKEYYMSALVNPATISEEELIAALIKDLKSGVTSSLNTVYSNFIAKQQNLTTTDANVTGKQQNLTIADSDVIGKQPTLNIEYSNVTGKQPTLTTAGPNIIENQPTLNKADLNVTEKQQALITPDSNQNIDQESWISNKHTYKVQLPSSTEQKKCKVVSSKPVKNLTLEERKASKIEPKFLRNHAKRSKQTTLATHPLEKTAKSYQKSTSSKSKEFVPVSGKKPIKKEQERLAEERQAESNLKKNYDNKDLQSTSKLKNDSLTELTEPSPSQHSKGSDLVESSVSKMVLESPSSLEQSFSTIVPLITQTSSKRAATPIPTQHERATSLATITIQCKPGAEVQSILPAQPSAGVWPFQLGFAFFMNKRYYCNVNRSSNANGCKENFLNRPVLIQHLSYVHKLTERNGKL